MSRKSPSAPVPRPVRMLRCCLTMDIGAMRRQVRPQQIGLNQIGMCPHTLTHPQTLTLALALALYPRRYKPDERELQLKRLSGYGQAPDERTEGGEPFDAKLPWPQCFLVAGPGPYCTAPRVLGGLATDGSQSLGGDHQGSSSVTVG